MVKDSAIVLDLRGGSIGIAAPPTIQGSTVILVLKGNTNVLTATTSPGVLCERSSNITLVGRDTASFARLTRTVFDNCFPAFGSTA
jgi:hypothetical protein